MRLSETSLKGAFLIDIEPRADARGTFTRVFCQKEFERAGLMHDLAQINHSKNYKAGTLRGMHYHTSPCREAKLIRCIRGKVFDVAVDLRKSSPTYLKWVGFELSEQNEKMFYIPPGFAHGFQTLEPHTELLYHCTDFYAPEHERGLRFDDPAFSIHWPLPVVDISDRDKSHPWVGPDFIPEKD